jgi:hypothetical protein
MALLWRRLFSFASLGFALAFGFRGQPVSQCLVPANRAGILARPFAIGDGVLQAMPGGHLGFPANDASPFFGPAKLPFLLPRNRQVCELVHDFLARVFVLFFLLSFFHSLTVKLRAFSPDACFPFIVQGQEK